MEPDVGDVFFANGGPDTESLVLREDASPPAVPGGSGWQRDAGCKLPSPPG